MGKPTISSLISDAAKLLRDEFEYIRKSQDVMLAYLLRYKLVNMSLY